MGLFPRPSPHQRTRRDSDWKSDDSSITFLRGQNARHIAVYATKVLAPFHHLPRQVPYEKRALFPGPHVVYAPITYPPSYSTLARV